MIHLSRLLHAPVIDSQYEDIGKLADVVTKYDLHEYPRVEALVVKKGKEELVIPWEQIENIGEKEVTLTVTKEHVTPYTRTGSYLMLVSDVLDQQIVDMRGVRVVRVNDLQLGKVGNTFAVVGIDVSNWSLLRRLGINVHAIPFYKSSSLGYIDWKDVSLVGRHSGDLRIKTRLAEIQKIHPADIANLIEQLNIKEGSRVVKALDDETAAKVLGEVHPKVRNLLVNLIGEKRAAEIIREMPTDEIADVVRRMPDSASSELLTKLESTEQTAVKKLSGYHENTAGSLMSTAFVTILPTWTIEEAQNYIRKISDEFGSIYYLYVVDGEKHLLGVLSVRTLFVSPSALKVSERMTTNMIMLRSRTRLSEVARVMTKYNLLSVAVIDKEKRIQGIISVDDIMRYLVPEA